MALDPTVAAILEAMASMNTLSIAESTPEQARQMYLELSQPVDIDIGEIQDRSIPGPAGDIPVRIYNPQGADDTLLPGIIFYHGGGWVIGDLDTHDGVCRALVKASGYRLIAIDYRLAPEHPFPAAVDDCYAALEWVGAKGASIGIDTSRLAVAGDSAGGNLSAVVAQQTRHIGPDLRLQVLIYPTTDATMQTGKSMDECAEGYFLEKAAMEWFYGHYIPEHATPEDARISPLKGPDLAGLAPAYVITAGFDPLRDEGAAYAEAMRAADNTVTHVDYEDMIHGFINMLMLPQANQALEGIAAALQQVMASEG